MTAFLFKSVLCSGSLLLIYYLVLEREKSYRFNRVYLLFTLLFSFVVYFITIKVEMPAAPIADQVQSVPTTAHSPVVLLPADSGAEPVNFWPVLLKWLYSGITLYLLTRFFLNLVRLVRKISTNPTIDWQGARLVLIQGGAHPHSFFHYIFLDRESFNKGMIEQEVLQHERAHVRQLHSLDILLVELLLVFAWFNPFVWLFRRAILLNHEFLADQAVVNAFHDPSTYQRLLLKKVQVNSKTMLTSPFNFLFLKKRFVMMTKQTSRRVALLKQIVVFPLIAAVGILFATKVAAQVKPDSVKRKNTEIIQSSPQKNALIEKKAKAKKDLNQFEQQVKEKKAALDRKQQDENLARKKEVLDRMQSDRKKEMEERLDQRKSAMEKKIALEKEMHERAVERQYDQAARQQDLYQRKVELDKEQHAKQIERQKDQMDKQKLLYENKVKQYQEQQKHYMEDQKIKMEKEHAEYEQKAKRYQEQQAHMTTEQKAKWADEQKAYEQKIQAYKAQQRSLDEQKVKMDKEAQALRKQAQKQEQETKKN